ncbi:MAG: electron transfer flavoprotein subunit beta/FixA family protein [Planctomycetaceae bacterium]|nr:electron transfer flavoprotein subunit beta/FixA family protein [Planctomycetaceae bacterium]MCP4813894.1 electron transfer flavoprotein subunit beta/FixA family protein [Planctomycetaceae bacterium]
MKILVPTKRVPDTDQKIRVQEDGLAIETANLPFVINPFDAIAVEEAIQIRETLADPVEILAVGIGTADYEAELRTALAMGADRAILVETPEPLDPWNAASILAALVQREQPDLVLMGKQAVDDDANQAGQFLAAQLGWPQATFASRLEFTPEGCRVARETDHGIEVVHVDLPAVVTTDLRLNEPRYASLPGILKARKKEIQQLPVADLGVEITPRIKVLELRASSTRRECVRVQDVDELIDRLRNDAKVL